MFIFPDYFLQNPNLCLNKHPQETSELILRCLQKIETPRFYRNFVGEQQQSEYVSNSPKKQCPFLGTIKRMTAEEMDYNRNMRALKVLKKLKQVTKCKKLILA